VRDRAVDFARRLMSQEPVQRERWIKDGFLLALSRPPTDEELAASLAFLQSQRERRATREPPPSPAEVRLQSLADFCQALFSLNEFIYVD
jgi:hypothetical protein